MIEQLETELRDALTARAHQLPAQAGMRLRQVDYHPRSRAVRPTLAFGAIAGAAGTAGAAVLIVGLGAGASPAFAGWTPSPTAASPGQIATAEATCKARLAAAPEPPAASTGPMRGKLTDTRGMSVKLTDTRGPFTFEIFANDHASASCISGPSFTALSGSFSTSPMTVPAGHVSLSPAHLTNRDSQAYSFAEGRLGPDVTATTLVLDDGTHVTATTANGWLVAWWPGSHDVKSALVTTPAGVTKQQFDTRQAPPCPTGGACATASGSVVGPGPGGGASMSLNR